MRHYVTIALAFTFFNQMAAAAVIFKPVPGMRLKPRIFLIWPAAVVIVAHSANAFIEFWQVVLGTLGLLMSLVLFHWARQTIRGKFFSYLSSGDRPEFICMAGPYAWIRNPFYASYLIAYFTAVFLMPDEITALVFLVMVWLFCSAAVDEEKKFLDSPLAEAYQEYMAHTGRFFPKVVRPA